MISSNLISEAFIRLALAIDQHIPGYVDAYFGPEEWRKQAEATGPRPINELLQETEALAADLANDQGMDAQRKDYLSSEVTAMLTILRMQQGEVITFKQQVEGLFDIIPEWIDEAVFEKALHSLEGFLPPGESLYERMMAHHKTVEIDGLESESLFKPLLAELRRRTKERFPLPDGEELEIQMVSDKSWAANNQYLGNLRSCVQVNRDLPFHITTLAELLAHEGYPGHHTETANKEAQLVIKKGHLEFSIALLYSPASVVAEGIAMQALAMIMTDDEWTEWHANEIFPRAKKEKLDAQKEREMLNIFHQSMHGILGNAALMLHDQGASEREVRNYLQHFELYNQVEIDHRMRILSDPRYASYTFNYYYGAQLLEELFSTQDNPNHWFTRLLTEPITVGQIRSWITNKSASSKLRTHAG
jgi:hypothetical protein